MGVDGKAFGISIGINGSVCLSVLLLFGLLRKAKLAHKYFAPRRYAAREERRPKPLPTGVWGWMHQVWKVPQADVVRLAGMDAAMHLRILAFGAELFFALTLWCCIVVLPTNLSGGAVRDLLGQGSLDHSNFTYWIPPPPPPLAPGQQAPPTPSNPKPLKAPPFYDKDIPPAPPGLIWWELLADVPPLPTPQKYFHDKRGNYSRFGWRYDPNFQFNDYQFSNMDLTTMTNVKQHDRKLWVHVASVWILTWYVWRLLYRYNKEAVVLRIEFLNSAKQGTESHTVLVRELPAVEFGTIPNRIENTVLRFLPGFIKHKLVEGANKTIKAAEAGMGAAVGLAARGLLPDSSVPTTAAAGPSRPVQQASLKAVVSQPRAVDRLSTTLGNGQHFQPGGTGDVELGQAPQGERAVTVLDAWVKAQRQLQRGMTMREIVRAEFEDVFPGDVEQVHMVHDTEAFDTLLDYYHTGEQQLQDLLDEYIRLKRLRKSFKRRQISVSGIQYGAWGLRQYGPKPMRVDALRFYVDHLKALLPKIQEVQRERGTPQERVVPTAFVTFRSRKAQVVASTSMMHHDQRCWLVTPAPGPSEIVWNALGWRMWERKLRLGVAWIAFFVIIAFFSPVAVSVQALIQVDKLRQQAPIVDKLFNLPLVRTLLLTLVPQLVLRIFLALIPSVLGFLCRWQGMLSRSQIEFGVVRKYFTFQVFIVFLAALLAGSVFNQATQLLDNPASIVRVIGTSAPQTAIFFCSYILLQATITKPISFLRLPGLFLYWFANFTASTERAKSRFWQQQYTDYGYEIPDNSMVILLGLVYSVICPIIAPIALAYFLVTSLIYKYQALYMNSERFQSGGNVWRKVFEQVSFSVIMFQVVMLGLMLIKGALLQSLAMLPLPILSIIAWLSYSSMFGRSQRVLSLRAATDLDKRDREEGAPNSSRRRYRDQLYQAPVFQLDDRRLHALVAEAERVDSLLQSNVAGVQDVEASLTPHHRSGADGGHADFDAIYEQDHEQFYEPSEDVEAGTSSDDDGLRDPLLKAQERS